MSRFQIGGVTRGMAGAALAALLAACSGDPGPLLQQRSSDDLPWSVSGYAGAPGDFDGDGLLDLIWSPHGREAVFFHNSGKLRFQRLELELPPLVDHHAMAVCDFDGDGDLDAYMTVGANRGKGIVEGTGNHLWEQVAKGTFENQAEGVPVLSDRAGRGRGAFWAQLDDTPSPELIVLNYASSPRLAHRGPAGWVDWTPRLNAAWAPPGKSFRVASLLIAASSDFDLDGDTDLFVQGTNFGLLQNQGNGQFRNTLKPSGLAHVQGAAHAATGDIDRDGDDDLLVTHTYDQPVIAWLNETEGQRIRFRKGPDLSSLPDPGHRHSAMLADLDNDGLLDIYVSQAVDKTTNVPNYAARGLGDGRFELRPDWGGEADVSARPSGAWPVDLDGDGDLDLAVFHGDAFQDGDEGTILLYENTAVLAGLTITLDSAGRSPQGLGARLTLQVGDRALVHQVRSVYNRFASTIPPAHFGVGQEKGPFRLHVRWHDGEEQTVQIPRAGRGYRVRRGDAEPVALPRSTR